MRFEMRSCELRVAGCELKKTTRNQQLATRNIFYLLRHPNLLLTLLMACGVIALEMVIKTNVLPAILWAALAAHLFLNFRLAGKPRFLTTVLLTVPFAIWYRYLPRGGMTGSEFAPIDLLLMIACYTLTLGVYHLLTTRTGGNSNQAFGTSIVAVALAGTATRSHLFLPLIIVFMALVIVYMRSATGLVTFRRRWPALARLGVAAFVRIAGGPELWTHVVVTGTLLARVERLAGQAVARRGNLHGDRLSSHRVSRERLRALEPGRVAGCDDLAYWASEKSDAAETPGTPEPPTLRRVHARPRSRPARPRRAGNAQNYLRGGVFDIYDHHGVWHALNEGKRRNLAQGQRPRPEYLSACTR